MTLPCVVTLFTFLNLAAFSFATPLLEIPTSPFQLDNEWERLRNDCIVAVGRLPIDPEGHKLPAIFSTHPAAGIYRLPAWRKVLSCGAFVELQPGQSSERSDWSSVKEALDLLNEQMYAMETKSITGPFGAKGNLRLRLKFSQVPERNYGGQQLRDFADVKELTTAHKVFLIRDNVKVERKSLPTQKVNLEVVRIRFKIRARRLLLPR